MREQSRIGRNAKPPSISVASYRAFRKTLMNQSAVTSFPVTDRVNQALEVTLRGVDELLPKDEWIKKLAKSEALPPADRAFAGLHFKDLAVGAKAPAPRTTAAPVLRAQAPLPTPAGAASNATQSARGNTVEMYQGANLQTVNY